MSSEQLNNPLIAEQRLPRPPVRRAAWKLYLLILLCVAPVVASYLAYYVFPPSERTNYGTLIEPQRPVPAIASTLVHGAQAASGDSAVGPEGLAAGARGTLRGQGLAGLKGRWILLAIDRGACELACAEKLFFMRQTHASLGKERGRLDRVLLITEGSALPATVLAAHPDLLVLRVRRDDVEALFPVAAGTALADHIYVIDPLHNLMLRFPENPDPARTRKDLQKLLKASRIG